MLLCSFLLVGAMAGFTTADQAAQTQSRTEVVIEKQDGAGKAVAMSPQHVFKSGEMIRIRFKTNGDGFLYVVNRDTKNHLTILFPREETGRNNQVHSGTEYLIPQTSDGWFRIQGEPGFDTAYFVLSPKELGGQATSEPKDTPPAAPAPKEILPNTLRPRCDDSLFRARGECMASSSGARGLSSTEKAPTGVPVDPKLVSRDLTFVRKAESTVILAKPSDDGIVVYEFRIAHQ